MSDTGKDWASGEGGNIVEDLKHTGEIHRAHTGIKSPDVLTLPQSKLNALAADVPSRPVNAKTGGDCNETANVNRDVVRNYSDNLDNSS